MISRVSCRAVSLVALFGVSSALCAQRAKVPTLEEILERLEASLNHYDTRLPSLFCDEEVVSLRTEPGQHDEKTVTESIFRLKRTPNPDHTATLVESREVKKVNGKPATSKDIDGPTLLNGAFEGGLAAVSLDQTVCMNYDLQRVDAKRPAEPYVVRFATVLMPQNRAKCLLKENSKGRAVIDPAAMQITHLELTTPRHTIVPGSSYRSRIVGARVITVDYAPVLLGNETFWMPSTITLRATSGGGSFHPIVWTYQATYRNYHKLEVTSHIVPASEVPAP